MIRAKTRLRLTADSNYPRTSGSPATLPFESQRFWSPKGQENTSDLYVPQNHLLIPKSEDVTALCGFRLSAASIFDNVQESLQKSAQGIWDRMDRRL